jgi:hypothetical protein
MKWLKSNAFNGYECFPFTSEKLGKGCWKLEQAITDGNVIRGDEVGVYPTLKRCKEVAGDLLEGSKRQ